MFRNATPNWDIVRAEYESHSFSPRVICQRHGISLKQLRYKRENQLWTTSRKDTPTAALLIARIMRLLGNQISALEKATDMPIDQKSKLLAAEVKTLDAVLKMGASERNVEPPSRRDMTDIRNKLIKRLDQSERK
ncbi:MULTISPECIES: hypothetical protein [unclassified Devosia]|uniref:hypothetical protein n=1 Tax=unclassified Devosia TaxID=196773 RepID=UPI00145CB6A9|nr:MULTISPECIES: hypothetical protein [unclassified Devosia]MBJ6987308.1 hypothetical protein [Devosia sp. MC521]QMW63486.1 hypothetical protein H4N61_03885 [Devosia sp. MC521]